MGDRKVPALDKIRCFKGRDAGIRDISSPGDTIKSVLIFIIGHNPKKYPSAWIKSDKFSASLHDTISKPIFIFPFFCKTFKKIYHLLPQPYQVIPNPGPVGSDVRDVSFPLGSQVFRPLTGPGAGILPAFNSFKILTVASGVKSSCKNQKDRVKALAMKIK
jgi:hypothetical protein